MQDFTHRAAAVCTLSLLVLALRAGSTPVVLASPDPVILPAIQAASAVVTKTPAPRSSAVRAQLTTLPLLFVPGVGRAGSDVRYVSLGPGPRMELTRSEVRLRTTPAASGRRPVSLALAAGARPRSVEAEELTPARLHDYGSSDPARWRRDVPTYQRVVYRDVYPATNLVFHGSQGRAEFDFVLRPGARPRAIALDVRGADRVTLQGGDVVVHAGEDTLRLHEPLVYQEGAAGRERVKGRFTVKGRRIGFEVAAYDRTRPLVIDPVVTYASYFGGPGGQTGVGIGADAAGNIYTLVGNDVGTERIVKLSADGQTLRYSVDLGDMTPRGLVVDAAGNAYIISECPYPRSGVEFACPVLKPLATGRPTSQGDFATYVTKLGPTGTLLFSSSMGGTGSVQAGGIGIDQAGNIYATASAAIGDFPLTRPAFNAAAGGFGTVIEAIAADTSRFLYVVGIHTGGDILDVSAPVADATGAVYLTGASTESFATTPGVLQPTSAGQRAGVVAKLAANGALVYGTFFGNAQTVPTAIAVDDAGNAYITGMAGPGLPTANAFQAALGGGASDAFVARLNAGATALVFSTYLGGQGDDAAVGIGLDASGTVYIAGPTTSKNFPRRNALPTPIGTSGSFVAALDGDTSALVYSTYFADAQTAIAAMHATDGGTVYLTGATTSAAFPTVHPFQATLGGGGDAFIAQIDPSEPAALRVAFTRPAAGATVSGTVWTDVWAENFAGNFNAFTLSIGGATVARGTGFNHVTLAWNSLAVPDGPTVLTATVIDEAGHVGVGTLRLVVANTAPLAAVFTAPTAGATIGGTSTIGMSATGARGTPIAFTLAVDGTQRFTTSGAAASAKFALDTTTLADGVHTLGLTVRDGADRSATATRSITVANGPKRISVILTSPPAGAISSGIAFADVWIEGAGGGSRTVTVSIGRTVLATATGKTNHFTLAWDSTKVANGPQLLVATVAAGKRTGVGTRDVNVHNGATTVAAARGR